MEELGFTIFIRRCRESGIDHVMTVDILRYLTHLYKLGVTDRNGHPRKMWKEAAWSVNFWGLSLPARSVRMWLDLLDVEYPDQHNSDETSRDLRVFARLGDPFAPLLDMYLSPFRPDDARSFVQSL